MGWQRQWAARSQGSFCASLKDTKIQRESLVRAGRGWGEAFVPLFYTLQGGGGGLEVGGAGELLSIWGGAEALESF